jgi:hypothetical protein
MFWPSRPGYSTQLMPVGGAVVKPESVPVKRRINKTAVTASYPGDSIANRRSGSSAARAFRVADAAAFLRGFLRLLAIEVNPGFCGRLRRLIDDPWLAVHAGSAESLTDVLRLRGLPAADVVVSGVPFSTLPRELAPRTAAAIHANLASGGRVVAYQCRSHFAGCLAPHLGSRRTAWEWRSLPPIGLFVWVKSCGTTTQSPLAADAAKLVDWRDGAQTKSWHGRGEHAQVEQAPLLRVLSVGEGTSSCRPARQRC